MKLDILISVWQKELLSLRESLYDLGNKPDSLAYILLSTEALRLSMCINDVRKVKLEEMTNVRTGTTV